ncbi:hypothetical protein MMC34_007340 [Xylographa carneopallida]|nr:hypothetical protein [Xylographa carneopallida]
MLRVCFTLDRALEGPSGRLEDVRLPTSSTGVPKGTFTFVQGTPIPGLQPFTTGNWPADAKERDRLNAEKEDRIARKKAARKAEREKKVADTEAARLVGNSPSGCKYGQREHWSQACPVSVDKRVPKGNRPRSSTIGASEPVTGDTPPPTKKQRKQAFMETAKMLANTSLNDTPAPLSAATSTPAPT